MPSCQEKGAKNQAAFWEISPLFFDYPINFYFNVGGPSADRDASWFHTASEVLWYPTRDVLGVTTATL
jgi:hypothetical protein